MNQNRRPLKFFREKYQNFDEIFDFNACDQKLLLVKPYLNRIHNIVGQHIISGI